MRSTERRRHSHGVRNAFVAATVLAAGLIGFSVAGSATALAASSKPHWLPYERVVYPRGSVTLRFLPGRELSCRLRLVGPDYLPHSWSYAATDQQTNLSIKVPKFVRGGKWIFRLLCTTPRHQAISTPAATLTVIGPRSGNVPLVGRHGPYMNVSLVKAIKDIGGGGGAVNPGFPPGQCTYYVWSVRSDIYNVSVANGAPRGGPIPGDPFGRDWWDAFNWAYMASHYGGFSVSSSPQVGAVMVEAPTATNPYGHVAYVIQVNSSTNFVTHEMNTYGDGDPSLTVYTVNRYVTPGMQFIYGVQGPPPTTTTTTTTQPPPTTTTTTPPRTSYGPFMTGCTGSGCLHGIYSEPSWQGTYLGSVYSPVYVYCYTTGTSYKGNDEYDLLTSGGYITDYYVTFSGQETASQYGIPHC